jgi:ankyrin repeat protein
MGKKKAPSKQTQMLQILVALREGNVDAIKGHIAKGMDVNAPLLGAGTEPVLVVCEEGHASALALLLSSGAKLGVVDDEGASPLFTAAANGHIDVMKLLVEKDAHIDVNKKNNAGQSPCWAAAAAGKTEAVRALVALGCDEKAPAKDGTTPHQAAQKGKHAAAAKLLAPPPPAVVVSEPSKALDTAPQSNLLGCCG